MFLRIIGLALLVVLVSSTAYAKKPPTRSKFYDFSDQLIDGQIKRPTTLYTDSRAKVKFDRLLKLKKSFLPKLFDTARESVFK
tara:strand:+ start:319 stop:567 length:249 start_codon:yes stop_codon:yes gene_type:complete